MKILIADDDPVSMVYLQNALQDWGYEVEIACEGKAAYAILQQADAPALAIINWMIPGMDGIDICRKVREVRGNNATYLIMLMAKTEAEFIVEAMNAGADDFICKPFNLEELQVRVQVGKRISELEQELRIKASHDALTGLYNRGAIIDILQKEMARQVRAKGAVSIIFVDLDHFKQLNDTYGHLAGDAILREVTRRISTMLRPYDSFGRYDGEELLIVLPACQSGAALEIAERVRMAVAMQSVVTEFGEILTSVSIGVAVADQENPVSFNDLLYLADNALYQAKDNGRNCVMLAEK